MRLKFIGEDGSMGLKHGKWYTCKVRTVADRVYVSWLIVDENGRKIGQKSCPYESFAAMLKNWEE